METLARDTSRKSWFRRLFTRPTWEELLEECASPRDVCRAVQRHIGYREEDKDRWTGARQTWQRGFGDCEEFAVLIQALCKELGLEASVHLYYPAKLNAQGHAIVVGSWEGRMWMSSNGSYDGIQSLDDARKRVARILWCEEGRVWGRALADSDLERMINGGASPSVASAAP